MSVQQITELFKRMRSARSELFQSIPGYDSNLVAYFGLREGRPAMMFMTDETIPRLESSAAVQVIIEEPQPSTYYLYFSVTDAKFEEVFIKFCGDLLSVVEGIDDPGAALSRLVWRYETWRSFWKNRRGEMSEEKVRGLVGELLYFEYCLDHGRDPGSVVTAWNGPQGGDQDFVFADGWAEVKTVRQATMEVQISSLEQLVNPSVIADQTEVQGHLAVIRLHSDPVGRDFITLSSLYKTILKRLENYPHAAVNFMNSVEMVGADIAHGNLENKLKMKVMEFNLYDVNKEGFPRIIRTDAIPSAVTKLHYNLSIPALEPWCINKEETNG